MVRIIPKQEPGIGGNAYLLSITEYFLMNLEVFGNVLLIKHCLECLI